MIRHSIFIFTLLYMLSVTDVHACLMTLHNDKMPKIMIYNKHDKIFTSMRKHEKRRFGNQYQRPHFIVYVQQKSKPVFNRLYTCLQDECTKTGNIQLKLSDIENGSGDAYLFNITKHKPYTSMAQELPMMQQDCQSCRGK